MLLFLGLSCGGCRGAISTVAVGAVFFSVAVSDLPEELLRLGMLIKMLFLYLLTLCLRTLRVLLR